MAFSIHSKILIWGSTGNKNIKEEESANPDNYLDIDLFREMIRQKKEKERISN